MKKEEYLERLAYYLDERDFSSEETEEILEDYEMMIDEALDTNPNETDFDELLGNPREIVRQIKKQVVIKRVKSNKVVALSPFIATIAFFVLGFGFQLWHPGWMVYLLIPITGVLSGRRKSHIKDVLELMPFLTLVIFLVIGLTLDIWHPTWLIFLLVPAVGILDDKKGLYGLWFVIFLIIPLVYLFSVLYFPFELNWLILLVLVFPAMNTSMISFRINGSRNRRLEAYMALTIVASTTAFLLIGLFTDYWHPGWLVFFAIPLVAILTSTKHMDMDVPLVAIMPFIATAGFFLAGEFLDGYAWSWLFYFLIPMTAILKEHK
jgi:hypothetical protein